MIERLVQLADNDLYYILADSLVLIRLAYILCLCRLCPRYMMVCNHMCSRCIALPLSASSLLKDCPITSSRLMSSATLLSLPREIRNMIYGYLSRELVIDWGYQPSPFPLGGHAAARLHVREAPLCNVLLSCAQIYHEYRQDKRFTNPSLEVNVEEDVLMHLREGTSTNHLRACKVLEQIVQVDLILYSTATWYSEFDDITDALDVLEPRIALLAPRLQTMRLVFLSVAEEDAVRYYTRDLKSVRARAAYGAAMRTQAPPEILA
jgi:hypothetical protein